MKNDEGFGFMSFSGNLPMLPTLVKNMRRAKAKASFACLKMREGNEKNIGENLNENEVRGARGYIETTFITSERS